MSNIPLGQECMHMECDKLAIIKIGELYFCKEHIPKHFHIMNVIVGQSVRSMAKMNVRPDEIGIIFTEETLKSILSNQSKLDQFIEWLKLEVYPALLKN